GLPHAQLPEVIHSPLFPLKRAFDTVKGIVVLIAVVFQLHGHPLARSLREKIGAVPEFQFNFIAPCRLMPELQYRHPRKLLRTNIETFGIHVMLLYQRTDKAFEVSLFGRTRNRYIALIKKGREFFSFHIAFKKIKRFLEQQTGRLVHNHFRIFEHKLEPHTLIFQRRKITQFFFCTPKMKEHRSRLACKEKRRFNRPPLFAHQKERLAAQQRKNLVQLLFNLRPNQREHLFIEHRRKESRWPNILLQEAFNQLALFNFFTKPYQRQVILIECRFVLRSGIAEQALIGQREAAILVVLHHMGLDQVTKKLVPAKRIHQPKRLPAVYSHRVLSKRVLNIRKVKHKSMETKKPSGFPEGLEIGSAKLNRLIERV